MHAKQQRGSAVESQDSSDWPAIVLQIAVATIFSGALAYVATSPQHLAHADSHVYSLPPAAPATPAPPVVQAQGEPVQVKNPFDPTEVFQFPAGTTEMDAHSAVAALLLQRARDRQDVWSGMGHRIRKRAKQPQSDEAVAASATVSRSPRLEHSDALAQLR